MVFVVVPHVERDPIEGTVVTVRFVAFLEHVVLRNEVSGYRVQTHGHNRPENQVAQDSSS
jgi:hypothetical protein